MLIMNALFWTGLCLTSVKMKVSYNYLHARATANSRTEAMNQCAIKILKVQQFDC